MYRYVFTPLRRNVALKYHSYAEKIFAFHRMHGKPYTTRAIWDKLFIIIINVSPNHKQFRPKENLN